MRTGRFLAPFEEEVDDEERFFGDGGTVSFGLCSIGVAMGAAQVPPNADLAIVSNTANLSHAKVGQEVTFKIVATNNGPDPAELFVNEQALVGLVMVSETCDRGISADTPSCEYGVLQAGETVTTTVIAQVQATGSKYASNTACVSSPDPLADPNTANDCATANLRIIGKQG
jgi:uncharacterized repeat protein (TIGR01451 family)